MAEPDGAGSVKSPLLDEAEAAAAPYPCGRCGAFHGNESGYCSACSASCFALVIARSILASSRSLSAAVATDCNRLPTRESCVNRSHDATDRASEKKGARFAAAFSTRLMGSWSLGMRNLGGVSL